MQKIAFLSLRKSKFFWGSMPPDLPRSVSVNQKSYIYAPDSSASAERSFSKLKSVKTVMRLVMNQERLGELLTLACERDLTDTINLDEIAIRDQTIITFQHFTANCTCSCK